MADLVALVADKNMHFVMKGILSRPEALGIRPVTTDFQVHPGRDGGARTSGASLLATERPRFQHALLVLDFEGSGTDHDDAEALEEDLDQQLRRHWGAAAKAIVIEPEVDVWLWGSDRALQPVIEWQPPPSVRDWLADMGHTFTPLNKPSRPKKAFEDALRHMRVPRSSALYQQVAETISLARCRDAAFLRLRATLKMWFGS